MATKVSADVASIVDVTARRNDSFYLQTTLTQADGSVYLLRGTDASAYVAKFEIYDSNDVKVLAFISNTGSSPEVNSTITVGDSTGVLTINVNASNMTIRSGTYKYKFVVSHSADEVTNTIMVGKFKVVDI
jgi:hypothetical protein